MVYMVVKSPRDMAEVTLSQELKSPRTEWDHTGVAVATTGRGRALGLRARWRGCSRSCTHRAYRAGHPVGAW
jgi:hypothetical protein